MANNHSTSHQVLARKYRPTKLSDLLGQDMLVQTLTRGLLNDRLPHAFLFHGTRGIGKTTSARILAKALNCIGIDGSGGPTPDPCGECEHCEAISNDRHLDILEIDAASRTGVDDIREIIDASRYKAVSARYKIYIIDEVHMLSKSAFNALLKTLEEPPAHVKFIFATTELRKIPETILSRCMRFDLKRMSPNVLIQHIHNIAQKESIQIDDEAAALIARAADGSCRDCLSLFDQAISLCGKSITGAKVRDMLGIVNRSQIFDLLQACLEGKPDIAIAKFHEMQVQGADPLMVIEDLLNIIHWISCLKTSPELIKDLSWPQIDRDLGSQLAVNFSIPQLLHGWQILNTGHAEISRSPSPSQAADILLLRLCYIGSLPPVDSLIKGLSGAAGQGSHSSGHQFGPSSIGGKAFSPRNETSMVPAATYADPIDNIRTRHPSYDAVPIAREVEIKSSIVQNPAPRRVAAIKTFDDIVRLAEKSRKVRLYTHLVHDVGFIDLQPHESGYVLTLKFQPHAPQSLVKELQDWLKQETNVHWIIKVNEAKAELTVAEKNKMAADEKKNAAMVHPTVKLLLDAFPDARTQFIDSSSD